MLIDELKKTQTILICSKDYWHESFHLDDQFWIEAFEIRIVETIEQIESIFSSCKQELYLGSELLQHGQLAKKYNFVVNEKQLLHGLNWRRGVKTQYEISCIEQANKKAALAHLAAKECFFAQGSEFDIHQTYLKSLENTDQQLPYQSIVALNEKSAILHYQHKKTSKNANTLLIDAGARFKCYASDITRTYCKKETPTTFLQLLSGLEEVQQNICKKVSAGKSF